MQSAIPSEEVFDITSFSLSAKKNKCRERCDGKPLDTNSFLKRFMRAAVSQLLTFCSEKYLNAYTSRVYNQNDLKRSVLIVKWVDCRVDLKIALRTYFDITQRHFTIPVAVISKFLYFVVHSLTSFVTG